MNTTIVPQTAESVQVALIPAPKGTRPLRQRVRFHGQYRACDTFWNRPMSKDEKTFRNQRDRWARVKAETTDTAQRTLAGIQWELWHQAFCAASEKADAEHAQNRGAA